MSLNTFSHSTWQTNFSNLEQQTAIEALEQGKIVCFPQLAFELLAEEQLFLQPDYLSIKTKNISFNINSDELKGVESEEVKLTHLKSLLRRYAQYTHSLINALFPEYSAELIQARTSFRPAEIAGRKTSYRKDDTRLHVDSFTATPVQGKRILRVFTNVNPNNAARVWRVGEPFAEVAQQFLPKVRLAVPGVAGILKLLRITKTLRSQYDHIMLHIHDKMKADLSYQVAAKQEKVDFWPGTTWVVFTDQVSHAAMSGQFLLEQSFYLPVEAMHDQSLSPLRVLESMLKRKLA
jgi:hypothetical protein